MLKDLEQRGAGSADVKTNVASQLSPTKPGNNGLSIIKIVGLVGLTLAGIYLAMFGMQSPLKTASAPKIVQSEKTPPPAKISTIPAVAIQPPHDEAAPAEPAQTITPAPEVESSEGIAPARKIDSPHLFETNLKSHSSTAQSAPVITQQEMMPATSETASTRAVDEKKPAKIEHAAPITHKPAHDNTPINKQINPSQRSDNLYQQALSNLQQGRVSEAQATLTQALEYNPANQEARLTLASLLLDNKRQDEARNTLAAGLVITPEQNDFRIALARLQVAAGDHTGALSTLEQGASYADNNSDYQSFFATMLQRVNRHEDAVSHYMSALSLTVNKPNNVTTSALIGLGISLQAIGKLEDAKIAFSRAQQTTALNPELSIFIEQRLKQINQRLQN